MFERVTIDGERFFAKTLGYRTDWIMRITGDHDLRTLKIWRAGIIRDVPPEIDHTVVGMAADGEGEDALLTILMRDVAGQLFAEGDATISLEDHLGLVDGLAALSARYWGWSDSIGLTTLEERLRFFALDNIAAEAAVADPPLPIRVAMQGWPRLAERAPRLSSWSARSTRRARRARGRDAFHAHDVLAGRLEDGQPRPSSGWPHDPARLGVSGIGASLLGSRLVSRVEPRPSPERRRKQRSRRYASARTPGRVDDWLVRPATRPLLARHDRVLRVGNGRRHELRWWEEHATAAPARRRHVPANAHMSQDHYRGAAMGWAQGATLTYAPIAALLVARTPIPLTGARVLDVGAGAGVYARSTAIRGAAWLSFACC